MKINVVCEKRKQYYEGLLNESERRSAEITPMQGMIFRVVEKPDQSIIKDEVNKALKKLKTGKAVRLDGVVMQYFKTGENACSKWLITMLNVCLSDRPQRIV